MQPRRAAHDHEVEGTTIKETGERVVDNAAVLCGEPLRVRARRRINARDLDVRNRPRRPCVCLADVASANQPDVNRQPVTPTPDP
jgi:hypothetical protein